METNKIYLGDAYELIKQIPDKSIDCVYTDIPYEMAYGGRSSPLGKRQYVDEIKTRALDKGVKTELWDQIDRVLRKKNLFVWCSKDQIPYLLDRYATKKGWNFAILVWCKKNPTPFVFNSWLPDVEYCLHFYQDVRLNKGVSLKSRWYASSINIYDKKKYDHPTIKPIELVERHLLHATQPGDLILDPFMGSGTTALAAKHTGRKWLGFEIDEKFHQIAVDRLQGWDAHGGMSLLDVDQDGGQMSLLEEPTE